MMAAAELAALRLNDYPPGQMSGISSDQKNLVFHLFDKNEDGRISSDELKEIMEELGADREDAMELMQLIDANSDGSLSSDEFEWFQRQVHINIFWHLISLRHEKLTTVHIRARISH